MVLQGFTNWFVLAQSVVMLVVYSAARVGLDRGAFSNYAVSGHEGVYLIAYLVVQLDR